MRIDAADPGQIHDVAMRMRDRDFDEFSSISHADTREKLAEILTSTYGGRDDVMCGSLDGKPICIGGTILGRPGVVSLLFFATDDFPSIALPITRFIRRGLFPRYEAAGVHRIEAVAMHTHTETHAWLKSLGLKAETGPLAGYGKNGEAFVQFSKVSDVRPAGA